MTVSLEMCTYRSVGDFLDCITAAGVIGLIVLVVDKHLLLSGECWHLQGSDAFRELGIGLVNISDADTFSGFTLGIIVDWDAAARPGSLLASRVGRMG